MKKAIFTIALTSAVSFANQTSITETMQLMESGISDVQKGFLYNDKERLKKGIATLQNANRTFQTVDVSKFIPNNNKVGVTKHINHNLRTSLDTLQKAIDNRNISQATKEYGKVIHSCVSCHTIVRGW